MRLRQLSLTAVAATAALVLAACGQQESIGGGDTAPAPDVAQDVQFEAGTTMAEIAEAGTIRIGTKFDQPLFGQRALDSTLTGFDTEIGRIIAAQLGIEPDAIDWVEAPSAQRETLIERGEVDLVVATYTINDTRRESVSFAGPYYQAGQTLMVRSDNTDITGPESLRASGARVCSVTGSTPAENILEYIDPAQLTLFEAYTQCRDSLGNNQVDVVTTDNVILSGYVSESDGAYKLVGETFTEEPYGIGITKGDVAFCEFINETLTEAEASGAYEAAWTATAGTIDPEVPTLPEFDPCS
ncbi:glutamate ABC transporter substrate-binding protein [Pseudonocardia sp.]|uniref:glutamate ABC transporter substrate-binding protein n=1 Tax=Pseudonocardia sp. TaxID=60912 RepID=UPI0026050130|nr:glutamate ABC transporter substrate-binding protein [Pseudonocardia sp.]